MELFVGYRNLGDLWGNETMQCQSCKDRLIIMQFLISVPNKNRRKRFGISHSLLGWDKLEFFWVLRSKCVIISNEAAMTPHSCQLNCWFVWVWDLWVKTTAKNWTCAPVTWLCPEGCSTEGCALLSLHHGDSFYILFIILSSIWTNGVSGTGMNN